jgi:multiple sugar transport system permease protein
MGQKKIGFETRINRWGYFFVLPFVLVYVLFSLYPTIYTFMIAFTDLKGLRSSYSFIGLANFAKLVQDQYFWGSVGNTFLMWSWNFVPQLGLALLLSIWLSDIRLKLHGKEIFRAVIYMPNLLTAASVALLFRSLFGYPTGPVNQFLTQTLGIYDSVTLDGKIVQQAFNFFREVTSSRAIVAFIQWWMWYGQTVILLMAGITSISASLYESAVVDGANSRQTTWYITLPMLRPMMLYILVTSMIGGMQMLDIPFLLTGMHGEPNYSIRTTNVYLYNNAFQGGNNYAYGAAISIGMFLITIVLALLINHAMKDRSDTKHVRKEIANEN